jgi:5'-3' exonuclease
MTDRPVLVVDGLNLFRRSYEAYPTMSSHGYQMGGAIGFLKTLGRIVNEISPSKIYVAWESGGSPRRRSIYPDYKAHRKPEKLNRFYEDDIPDSDDNRMHQMVALLGFLKCAPVCQIYVPDCEGDDIVAYLCRGPLRGVKKVIASSDKDMYQLLDADTTVYSLHKKTYVTPADVLEEFRVLPENFAFAKALCGDKSDNIPPPIPKFGFKTAAKHLPILSTDGSLILQDVFNYCAAHKDDNKIFERILGAEAEVRRNWQLVYLDTGCLAPSQAAKVDYVVNSFKPHVNKMGLMRLLIKEGVNDFDVEGFFYAMNSVEGLQYV